MSISLKLFDIFWKKGPPKNPLFGGGADLHIPKNWGMSQAEYFDFYSITNFFFSFWGNFLKL